MLYNTLIVLGSTTLRYKSRPSANRPDEIWPDSGRRSWTPIESITTGEIGIGVFFGYLSTESSGKRFAGPKTVTMENKPKILVYDDIDKTMKLPFPEKSAEPGGSYKDDFVELLEKAVASKNLQITITGKSSLDAPYILELMRERPESIRTLIGRVRELHVLDAQGGNITENESLQDGSAGIHDDDPNRDCVVEVHIKGCIIVKEPVQ
jgi:hypothetical protein